MATKCKFRMVVENEGAQEQPEGDEQLNESWLAHFADWVKWFVKNAGLNEGKGMKLKGTQEQIDAFTDALREERKYFVMAQEEGLVSEELIEQEIAVVRAVTKFEDSTGVPWPIE